MSATYVPSQLSELTGSITTSSISDFAEGVDDRVGALILAGSGITKTYDDTAGTLTIAATGGGGGLTVGSPITGGTNNYLLYQDSSGNLAQNSKMTFDGNAFSFATTAGSGSNIIGLINVSGNYGGASLDSLSVNNYYYSAGASHVLGLLGGSPQTVPLCRLRGISSTSTIRTLGYLDAVFASSTDATYTGRVTISAQDYNEAAGGREGLRVESSGTAAKIAFFGGTAASKPTVSGSKGANAALGSLLSALAALGLITDSTT